MPIATGDLPNPVEHLAREPTHDEIARRAYQLYEERGAEPGRDWEDWFRADRELRQVTLRRIVDRIMGTEEPYAVA